MNKAQYYGTDGVIDSVSYLEFGSINIKGGKKTIWGYWQDAEAYDLYMFARYARDLFAFRNFVDKKSVDLKQLDNIIQNSAHTNLLDYIFKYAGLISVCNEPSGDGICESGSSLMGLIDECIALDKVFANSAYSEKILSQSYIGSDISEMMNQGAATFHLGLDLRFSTASTIHELLKEFDRFKLFYGLSVSMRYALREAGDLVQIGKQSDLAIFNRLSLHFEKTTSLIYGTGKYVYIISLPELVERLEQEGIIAKYVEESMQWNRDGENTVRASIVLSKDRRKIDCFIANYNDCIKKSYEITGRKAGTWNDLRELRAKK